jgi:hypothetical protein
MSSRDNHGSGSPADRDVPPVRGPAGRRLPWVLAILLAAVLAWVVYVLVRVEFPIGCVVHPWNCTVDNSKIIRTSLPVLSP